MMSGKIFFYLKYIKSGIIIIGKGDYYEYKYYAI